jgi:hypothetical protein
MGDWQKIWMFGSKQALALLIAILAIDMALTLLHCLLELRAKLWRYFGDIAGVEIPDRFGLWLFFIGLTLLLWSVVIFGIGGAVLWLGAVPWRMTVAPGLLGFLIGCRVSDGIFSHIQPWLYGYRSNPALGTVPLYFLEAVFLSWAFSPMLSRSRIPALIGLGIGGVFFFAIIPLLVNFGPRLFEPQDRLLPGTPRPDHGSTTSAAANRP